MKKKAASLLLESICLWCYPNIADMGNKHMFPVGVTENVTTEKSTENLPCLNRIKMVLSSASLLQRLNKEELYGSKQTPPPPLPITRMNYS